MSGGPRAADGGPSAVFPFGGDVTQAINPWRWWFDTMTQIGLINIRVGRTPDEDLERRITEEVASYGRQLGRLSEALDSVIRATCEAEGGSTPPGSPTRTSRASWPSATSCGRSIG